MNDEAGISNAEGMTKPEARTKCGALSVIRALSLFRDSAFVIFDSSLDIPRFIQ
jgi:hypothetical protein